MALLSERGHICAPCHWQRDRAWIACREWLELGNRWLRSGMTANVHNLGARIEVAAVGLYCAVGYRFDLLVSARTISARESQAVFNQWAGRQGIWLGALNLGLVGAGSVGLKEAPRESAMQHYAGCRADGVSLRTMEPSARASIANRLRIRFPLLVGSRAVGNSRSGSRAACRFASMNRASHGRFRDVRHDTLDRTFMADRNFGRRRNQRSKSSQARRRVAPPVWPPLEPRMKAIADPTNVIDGRDPCPAGRVGRGRQCKAEHGSRMLR